MSELRVGVVGAGHMGSLHAKKVAALAETDRHLRLVGVADIDRERAQRLAGELGVPAEAEASPLLARADAVIVAVPTLDHHRIARQCLESGLDVLVEKPIAATLEEAEDLLRLARMGGRVLQVGHQEWFNGAMRVIREHVHTPRFAEIHRLGPFPDRGTDVDVVRDLMIHDLEILQQLLGEEPERLDAVGVPVLTELADIANARLTFPSRCVANLTASRVSMTPMRKFRLFQRDGYFSIDFLAQKATIIRRLPADDGGAPRIEVEDLKTDLEDTLMRQLEAFIASVRERALGDERGCADRAAVYGSEALAALRTALRVVEAMPPLDELR